jgi:transcriptional regulator with XRE-family HTH domain
MSITSKKLEFLKASVETLRRDKGLTQREIAERMGESEAALSGKLGGGRGITDDYLDKFGQVFGMHFLGTASGNTVVVDKQLFSDLIEQVKTQTHLLNAVLDRMDALQKREG